MASLGTTERQQATQVSNEIDVLKNLSVGGHIQGLPTVIWSRNIKTAGILNTILITAEVGTILSGIAVAKLNNNLKSIYEQLKTTLAVVHARNYVHHDISPTNIIMTDDGRAVLLDWGLAKVLGAPCLGFSGTEMFSSVSYNTNPIGYQYTSKDDLESLIYTLCFVLRELPWASKQTQQARLKKKLQATVDEICGPLEFLKADLRTLRTDALASSSKGPQTLA
jgi:serine/threonine protein kinase